MITRPCEKHPEAGVMPMPCPLCRVAELEALIRGLHGQSAIALGILRNNPWPTPHAATYQILEMVLSEVQAFTQPKG